MHSFIKSNITSNLLITIMLLAAVMTTAMTYPSLTYAESSADHSSKFTQQELEQMLAPIALYPDALLSQLLMAATYPLEVVEAARWSAAHNDLVGDEAVKEVADKNWDPSVKSMVAFPRILAEMNEKLDWTEQLGDAFLDQQEQVTDTVQSLRQKAYDAGNLRSSDQLNVNQQGQTIEVVAVNPQVTYVPYYNPVVVYGPWWGPAPPVYWDPWPGYYYARPGYANGFAWGVGVTLATGFFFGGFDWHHHQANVVNVNNYYYNNNYYRNHYGHGDGDHHDGDGHDGGHNWNHNDNHDGNHDSHDGNDTGPQPWHHDPSHRHGVPYRDPQLRQQYGRASPATEEHRSYRGRDFSNNDRHPDANQSDTSPTRNRQEHRSTPTNPTQAHGDDSSRRAERHATHELRAHAFEDIDRGSTARDYSNRGRVSHQEMISQTREKPAPRAPAARSENQKKIPREH